MLNNNYDQLVLIKFFTLASGAFFIIQSIIGLLNGEPLDYAKSSIGIFMLFVGISMR